MRYLKWTMSAMAVVAVFASGCAKDSGNGSIGGISRDEANRMNAEHSKFEQSEDPPFTPATRYAAGQFAESQGNLPVAIEQYQEAVKLDPHHTASLYRIGVLETQRKNYDKAIAGWQHYVEATGDDSTGYSNLGFCFELSGRPEEAESAYRMGIEKDARNQPCQINYGLMLARTGRITEATIHLQSVLSPSQVHYNIGSAYEQVGKREQARIEYRKALELDPSTLDAKTRLSALD